MPVRPVVPPRPPRPPVRARRRAALLAVAATLGACASATPLRVDEPAVSVGPISVAIEARVRGEARDAEILVREAGGTWVQLAVVAVAGGSVAATLDVGWTVEPLRPETAYEVRVVAGCRDPLFDPDVVIGGCAEEGPAESPVHAFVSSALAVRESPTPPPTPRPTPRPTPSPTPAPAFGAPVIVTSLAEPVGPARLRLDAAVTTGGAPETTVVLAWEGGGTRLERTWTLAEDGTVSLELDVLAGTTYRYAWTARNGAGEATPLADVYEAP